MNGMFTVEEAAGVMHGHPTLSEAFDEAVSNLLGKAIHMPPVKTGNQEKEARTWN